MSRPIQGNERQAALAALSNDQRKQLAAYAETLSRGTGREGKDLLQDAFVRWLCSDKAVEGPEQTCDFLRGAISSIRSNIFRHKKVVRRYEGVRAVAETGDEDDPLEQAADPVASTDGALIAQELYNLCNDEEVQLLVMKQTDNASPVEIQAELGWDEKKYEAVQKRKRRLGPVFS